MKKFLVVLGILFLSFCGFLAYDTYFKDKIPVLEIQEEVVHIDKLYIYGTHLNMEGSYGFTDTPEFVLYNGEFISYKLNTEKGAFNISDLLNGGIYLDDIPVGDYYLFLRTKYTEDDKEKYKYYSIKNDTNYQATTYYTMSDYNKKMVIDNEEEYPTMMLHVTSNNDSEVYDVVIDPGHGGMDGGATRYGYKETDFTLDIANKLKASLTKEGFTVKLTHEEGQLTSNDKLEEYGIHGRAVIPREVNAKYMFSIHLNSNTYDSVNGLEVYTAKNINYDFAKSLVNNITSNTGLEYSNNRINKVFDGIYSKNFTDDDINSSLEGYRNKNLNAYDITTNSNYYYIIRETGGIVTGAYVDDRNSDIIGNPYVNSNVGTETYLLELGYLSNKSNLDNMINNMDKYVDAIVNSIKTLKETTN